MTHTGLSDLRSDQELWEAANSGESDAFGQLFERHQERIYNFCFRRTGSWGTAEDLVAVVFLEAWRTRRRMELQDGSLLPWLFAIATNVSRRQHRATARHREALGRIAARYAEVVDPAVEVVDRLADEERMAEVLVAFDALPSRERDVLQLAVFGELNYVQISAALGIPIGTVRSRLSRGRSRLRGSLAAADIRFDAIEGAQR